jgi:hypothetical protein
VLRDATPPHPVDELFKIRRFLGTRLATHAFTSIAMGEWLSQVSRAFEDSIATAVFERFS